MCECLFSSCCHFKNTVLAVCYSYMKANYLRISTTLAACTNYMHLYVDVCEVRIMSDVQNANQRGFYLRVVFFLKGKYSVDQGHRSWSRIILTVLEPEGC